MLQNFANISTKILQKETACLGNFCKFFASKGKQNKKKSNFGPIGKAVRVAQS